MGNYDREDAAQQNVRYRKIQPAGAALADPWKL
jgi:hypothetical protein